MTLTVRAATAADLDFAVEHLQSAGLPTQDIAAAHLAFAAQLGDAVVGIIGYESFGATGLLRSLVVSGEARGSGIGARLVGAVEQSAAASGAAEIWLLTMDADQWFARHGYVERDRSEAPDTIRGTTEFSDLCPGDAVLMSKSL